MLPARQLEAIVVATTTMRDRMLLAMFIMPTFDSIDYLRSTGMSTRRT